jgi:hypothetical protein
LSFDFKKRDENFLLGRGYVLLLAVLTLLGHMLALDAVTMCISLAFASFSVLLTRSLLPVMPTLLIFIFQMSVKNAPSIPSFSDHYFTGWRAILLPVFLLIFTISAVYIFFSERKWSFSDVKSLPDFKAAMMLALAFLLNGAFSGEWRLSSLGFGVLQIMSFFLIGYFFRLGFFGIDRDKLIDYFSLVAAVIGVVLVIETAWLYLTGGVVAEGVADKGRVLYGWGIWTTAGMDMAVLIPVIFLGASRSAHPWIYLTVAHLTYVSAVLTLSRNALIFATLSLIFSAIFYIFRAPLGKRLLRVYLVLFALSAAAAPLYFPKLLSLLSDYVERGFSDNGRLSLWRYGLDRFLEAPLFGKGFFAIEPDTFRAQNFFPPMLHNTLIQLAASTGIFGLASYLIYRVKMLAGLLKSLNSHTVYLFISMTTLLLMSLLDNFVFYIQPTFLFSVEYALIHSTKINRHAV